MTFQTMLAQTYQVQSAITFKEINPKPQLYAHDDDDYHSAFLSSA
jgi:hypothetical protein